MSTVRLHAQGKEYYRHGRFADALKCFDEAIEASNDVDIHLLDNRAATHAWLGSHALAIRDGRRMIKIDPTNPRGYLRTGKILQQMGEARIRTALQIYELGIKNVLAEDPDLKRIKTLRDNVSRVICPPKSQDPFCQFPTEIAEMVLRYLSFRELVLCTSVSRGWKTFIQSIPDLWHHIDFSEATKNVRYKTITAYVTYSQTTCRSVTIDRHHEQSTLGWLLQHCKKLVNLSILRTKYEGMSLVRPLRKNGSQLRSLYIGEGTQLSQNALSLVLHICPLLETGSFKNVIFQGPVPAEWSRDIPSLRELTIVGRPVNSWWNPRESARSWSLDTLFERVPNLEKFGFDATGVKFNTLNIETLSRLRHLDLRVGLEELEGISPHIQTLRIDSLRAPEIAGDFRNCSPTLNLLPNLESLELGKYTDLSVITQYHGSGTNRTLRRVVLEAGTEHPSAWEILSNAIKAWGNVEEFGLAKFDIGDQEGESLAERLPNLRRLSLAHTKVTGITVRKIVEHLPPGQLEFLDLTGCDKASYDAIEWARAKGIYVRSRTTLDSVGKKVRYD